MLSFTAKQTTEKKPLLFCQKTERKLHLEESVGNRSWRFELSPLRTKMLCSQAVCWEGCVGGSEVAKLLVFLLEA